MSHMVKGCVRILAGMSSSLHIDYLLIGHVSHDCTNEGVRPGGSVTFAGRTVQALGHRPAIITSAAPDADLSALAGLPLHIIPAEQTTTFENRYPASGRQQLLHGRAARLTTDNWPVDWTAPAIVHLAPIADEVDPDWAGRFPDSVLGLTPQGWLRAWDAAGRVFPRDWPDAARILPLATAVVLSEEDLGSASRLELFRHYSRLLVLTTGAQGCYVYWRDEQRHFSAPTVNQVDPTGAGDIFAAAFFLRLAQTEDPWQAAEFANRIAALSVTADGLAAKIEVLQAGLSA